MKKILTLFILLISTNALAEWIDVSGSVEISSTKAVYDRVNNVMYSYVYINNATGADITGDVRLRISNYARLPLNHDGVLEDRSVFFSLPDAFIAGGETEVVRVEFARARSAFSFDASLQKVGFIESSEVVDYNPPSTDRFVSDAVEPYVDGSFVVWMDGEYDDEVVKGLANVIGATVEGKNKILPVYMFLVKERGLDYEQMLEKKAILEGFIEIESVSINTLNQLSVNADDAVFNDAPDYYIESAKIDAAWDFLADAQIPAGGKDVPIGVVDTALTGHRMLDMEWDDCLALNNCTKSILAQKFSPYKEDPDHGDRVVGIIGATHDDDVRTGIMQEKLIYAVPFNSTTFSFISQMTGLVVLKKARIVNVSLGGTPMKHGHYCVYPSAVEFGSLVLLGQEYSLNKCKKLIESEPFVDLSDIASEENFEKLINILENDDDVLEFEALMRELVDKAEHDFLIVQAAGNENHLTEYGWGFCKLGDSEFRKNVLCVGALKNTEPPTFELSDYSNYGAEVDIATFGDGMSALAGKKKEDGTSYSAPIVTGVAGLIWNAFPELTASQVRHALINGTDWSVADKRNSGHRIPVLNAEKAIMEAAGGVVTPNASIFEITPLVATVNQATTFTIQGRDLDQSLTINLDDSDCSLPDIVTGARIEIRCTPREIGNAVFTITNAAGVVVDGTVHRDVQVKDAGVPLAIDSQGVYKINGVIYEGPQDEPVTITYGDSIEFFMRRSGVTYLDHSPTVPFYGYPRVIFGLFSREFAESENDSSLIVSLNPVYPEIGRHSLDFSLWSYTETYDEAVGPDIIVERPRVTSIQYSDNVTVVDGVGHVYSDISDYYIPGGNPFTVEVEGHFSHTSRVDMIFADGVGCPVVENNNVNRVVFECVSYSVGPTTFQITDESRVEFMLPNGELEAPINGLERPVIGEYQVIGAPEVGVTRTYSWRLTNPEGARMTVDFSDGRGELPLTVDASGRFSFDKAFSTAGFHRVFLRSYNHLDMLGHYMPLDILIYGDVYGSL